MWLEELLAVDPSTMCLSLLGAACDRLGEREAAKEAFRKAIDLDESYAEAYFNLGLLLADDDQDVEAEKLLRRATQLDPNSHRAHGALGVLLQEFGNYSEAEAELKRTLELNPTDSVARDRLRLLADDPRHECAYVGRRWHRGRLEFSIEPVSQEHAASHRVEYGHATPEWELRSNLGLLCGNYKKTGG